MGLLSFLSTAKVEEAPVVVKQVGTRAKQRNPNPALLAIRLWWDGKVFPSIALIDKFDLNYRSATFEEVPAKAAEGVPGTDGYKSAVPAKKKTVVPVDNSGNAFDIIDSSQWHQFKGDGRMLFISPVAKHEPKVDLFGTTTYNEDGSPITAVVDQGAATYGTKFLLPLVDAIFGIKLAKAEAESTLPEYVDLVVCDTLTEDGTTISLTELFTPKNGIGLFPKVISRGEEKGQADFVRREKPVIYGLLPLALVQGEETPTVVEEEVPAVESAPLAVEEENAVAYEESVAELTEPKANLRKSKATV